MGEFHNTFELKGTRLFLDGHEIKGIESLKLLAGEDTGIQCGMAEIELKIIVKFIGDKQEKGEKEEEP